MKPHRALEPERTSSHERSGLLLLLLPAYAVVITAKHWLFEHGILPRRSLRHPVISIGSLSTGGAGKTPVVLMLARLLQQQGFEVRILSRGYGRKGTKIERVDIHGDAARFGDEPLMLARSLPGASVWVGADRFQAGQLSERSDTAGARAVYLLDDGFQHRKLARDVDLLLLTGRDLADNLLPAGNLREPLSAMARADIVVIRDDERTLAEWVAGQARERMKLVWVVRRSLDFVDSRTPSRPVVFSGLARPESFHAMLSAEGISPAATVSFRDHHPYTSDNIDKLLKAAAQHDGDGFMTTEKDAVKLSPAMLHRLETVGPMVVPRLTVKLLDEAACMHDLLRRITAKAAGP